VARDSIGQEGVEAIMENFVFHRPKTVAEAVAALKGAEEGKLLAGGQSLIPVLKLDMARPSDVVSLGAIAELKSIARQGDAIVIGALATHADVASSDVVKGAIPALAALAGKIGDPQVRNRGTLGGSVAHADPAADYPAALVALGATVKTDRRSIAAEDFFTDLFATALAADEIVTSVSFPIPKRAAYAKFGSPASKYALVGVMVAETATGARVAVTGAAAKVFRVAEMETKLAAKWSADSLDGVSVPPDELRGDTEASAEYRSHLIGVMAKRAVAAAQ
jgi:carbon-monoxide dehydrogenase medium subunit